MKRDTTAQITTPIEETMLTLAQSKDAETLAKLLYTHMDAGQLVVSFMDTMSKETREIIYAQALKILKASDELVALPASSVQ